MFKFRNIKILLLSSMFCILVVGIGFYPRAGAQGSGPSLPVQVSATSIPTGCPGSVTQGPPVPGVCEAIPPGCPGATRQGPPVPGTNCPYEASQATTSSNSGNLTADCKKVEINKDNCGIIAYLVDFINILSGLVGIVCVVMIAVWGLQYTVSRDNPQMVAQARMRMVQTVLALVGYLFIYAFLQWVVPGGVLPG